VRTSVRDFSGFGLWTVSAQSGYTQSDQTPWPPLLSFDHSLSDALELLLLVAEKAPDRFPRHALAWHGRLCREVNITLEEAQAILAALALLLGERKENAAYALADLLSRRGLEQPCELLIAWGRR
jgi:hypothetical protein